MDKFEVLKKYWGYESFRFPQEETIDSVLSGKDTVTLAATGVGKALHKDTVLQTSFGSVTMGSVEVGDYVLGKDGKDTKVLAKYQPMTEDHYLITFEDGTKVKACGDHLWYVDIPRSNSTEKIYDTKTLYSKMRSSTLAISIPLCEQITVYSQKNLPTNPYVYGLWLGDGSIHSSDITASKEDFEVYKKYIESFDGYSVLFSYVDNLCKFKVYRNTFDFNGKPTIYNAIRKKLIPNRNSKVIPEEFMLGSLEQRKELLAGLLDSDGCFENNYACFYNTNKKLVDQVSRLCNSLGFRTTLNSKTGSYKDKNGVLIECKVCYCVRIAVTEQVFRLKRKADLVDKFLLSSFKYQQNAHYIKTIEKIEDNAEDYFCITVDNEDKLYLITDKFIPTHNTVMFQIPALLLDGISIVVSPLKSLQKDQVDRCASLGIPVALINSDTGKRARKKVVDAIEDKSLKILYVSPETLLSDSFKDIRDLLTNVPLFVIDEAHCCFPGSSRIITDSGSKSFLELRELLENGLELPLAKSYNTITKSIEYKNIKNVFKNPKPKEMIRIQTIKEGKVDCTPNHVFFTDRGEIEAKDLLVGDKIYSDSSISKKKTKYLCDNTLQFVLGSISELSKDVINFSTVKSSRYIRVVNTPNVYDLEVEDNHNYFVITEGVSAKASEKYQDTHLLVHNCSSWSDFRPKYRLLKEAREEYFPDATVLAVTATADDLILEDIHKYLGVTKTSRNLYRTSFDRPSIEYKIINTQESSCLRSVASLIKANYNGQTGVIFCGTQKKTVEYAEALSMLGIKARAFHSKIKKSEKDEIQESFLKGDLKLICATTAFGMGIDKPDIRYVIHIDPPTSFDDYSQQVGRASRDGLPSVAYMFYNPKSLSAAQWLLRQSTPNPERLKVKYQKLKEFHDFCKQSSKCRRKSLLAYFGEDYPKNNCGSCDVCRSS